MSGKRSRILKEKAMQIASSFGNKTSYKDGHSWAKGTPMFVHKKLKKAYRDHRPILIHP